MLVGFFDSGVGGLTVLHEARRRLKEADYVYYADVSNVPYGEKTKAQVRQFVFSAADFLAAAGIDALVVACNTATSVAIDDLRSRLHIPVIGMEPAVKPAVENHRGKRILVTATELTLREDKLKKLISRLDCWDIVDMLPLPGLVTFAEREVFDEEIVLGYLREQLGRFGLDEYRTVVLGCTHFIFYREMFRALLGPGIDIIDGNRGTVCRLLKALEERGVPAGGSGLVSYYQSGGAPAGEAEREKFGRLLRRLEMGAAEAAEPA